MSGQKNKKKSKKTTAERNDSQPFPDKSGGSSSTPMKGKSATSTDKKSESSVDGVENKSSTSPADKSDRGTSKMDENRLEQLKNSMKKVNICLHFTRNSQKWKTEFYHQFVLIATGPDKNWSNLPDSITRPWDAARFSFDQMYGLINAWTAEKGIFIDLINYHSQESNKAPNKRHPSLDDIKESLDIVKKINEAMKETDDNTFEKTVARIKQLTEIQKDLKGEKE